MKRIVLSTLAGLMMLGSVHARAQSSDRPTGSIAELAFSNDTLQLKYETNGGVVGVDDGRLAGALFISEERDQVFSAGLTFPTNLELGRFWLGLGPQVYAAFLRDENSDVMSVSLGAQFRMLLNRRSGLAIAGHAYYAPDILTFGSADNLTDLAARVEIGLASNVVAFGGMRWFEFDLAEGEGERTLQEEVFVGVGYKF